MMIISLSGKTASGKDEAAKALASIAEGAGWQAVRLGFADALKEACRKMYGFSDEQLYGHLKNVVDDYWGITPRAAMIDLGKRMRERDPLHWVKALVRRLREEPNAAKPTLYTITDTRFVNEAEALLDRGAWLWRMRRADRPIAAPEVEADISETDLDTYDRFHLFVNNPGAALGLEGLRAHVLAGWEYTLDKHNRYAKAASLETGT